MSIAPGATQVFQMTFAPTATGDFLALLQLTTDDPASMKLMPVQSVLSAFKLIRSQLVSVFPGASSCRLRLPVRCSFFSWPAWR